MGLPTLSKGIKWRVGSGENLRFWTDNWLSCGPLQQHALTELTEDMLQLNKLLTNVQRQRRGLTQIPNCPRCAALMETIEHLFKDCPISIAAWNGIGVDFGDLGSLDFDDWILRNLKSKRKLSWNRPSLGGCKINSDGSRNNTTGQIGVASVLRDATGAWLKGYYVNLGIGSVLEVELWAIFWGLSLAWDSGFRTVEVESDSKIAVTLLNSLTISTHPLFNIISCCRGRFLANCGSGGKKSKNRFLAMSPSLGWEWVP
ncbi:unnamed protein product [Prunus armeniaca]